MESKNLEGFKPLSEKEENQIVGGRGANPVCQDIKRQIGEIEAKINAGDGDPNLKIMLQDLIAQYQKCVSQ